MFMSYYLELVDKLRISFNKILNSSKELDEFIINECNSSLKLIDELDNRIDKELCEMANEELNRG